MRHEGKADVLVLQLQTVIYSRLWHQQLFDFSSENIKMMFSPACSFDSLVTKKLKQSK